jgi:hypothetical protein
MTSLALLSAADFLLVPVAPCSACLLSHPVDHDCAQSQPEETGNA